MIKNLKNSKRILKSKYLIPFKMLLNLGNQLKGEKINWSYKLN